MAEVMSEWQKLEPVGKSNYGTVQEPLYRRTNIMAQVVPGGVLLFFATNGKDVGKSKRGAPVVAHTGGGIANIGDYGVKLEVYKRKNRTVKGMDLNSLPAALRQQIADMILANKDVEEE